MKNQDRELASMWARHSAQWRDSAQVTSQWREAANVDPRLLQSRARQGWWGTLERLGITLFVTREYEHLAIAATAPAGRSRLSFFPVPHPSGMVADRHNRRLYMASTRNPNQVYTFKPATHTTRRAGVPGITGAFAVPVSAAYYPGSLYMHDLALLGGGLYANAVGHNAVIRLSPDGGFRRVWWPKCIETDGRGVFDRNYIQLNSIAAGKTLPGSCFSASSSSMGRLRPGHLNYPVDGRGVIFSGRTREPICTGLTRPHSARLHEGAIWVANSGYGELGYVQDGRLTVVCRLPGWTRGLCLIEDVAFVATSRVIPRYARYAPGVDCSASRCAVHAVCCKTGRLFGSLEWPYGNQVFAIDWMPNTDTLGFLFEVGSRRQKQETAFFSNYITV